MVTGDGIRSLVRADKSVLLHHGRLFTGLQAISRDITERRRIEGELRAGEEQLRVLYENGPVSFHGIDRQGVIRCVDGTQCDLLGIPAAELAGGCRTC